MKANEIDRGMVSIAGKIIVTTQPEQQATRFMDPLEKAGATTYNLPMIRIVYSLPDKNNRRIFNALHTFSLLIFTSRNGVNGFFQLLKIIKGNYRLPENLKIAVIGESTANELRKFKQPVHITHTGTTSDEFAEFLKEKVLRAEDKILLSQGNLAPEKLQEDLKNMVSTERINVYDTVMPEYFNDDIMHIVKNQDADLMVITSPSAFRNFLRITGFRPEEFNMPIACIGKTTGAFITSKGYRVGLMAEHPTFVSFAKEIITYLNKTN